MHWRMLAVDGYGLHLWLRRFAVGSFSFLNSASGYEGFKYVVEKVSTLVQGAPRLPVYVGSSVLALEGEFAQTTRKSPGATKS
mmetsp:Transcript_35308/g.52504  ORF Transcript_35308/g.52504 Transcript_35308/m.52504 type:complete len:83 (-) Transcript_35308:1103-1351(-)